MFHYTCYDVCYLKTVYLYFIGKLLSFVLVISLSTCSYDGRMWDLVSRFCNCVYAHLN